MSRSRSLVAVALSALVVALIVPAAPAQAAGGYFAVTRVYFDPPGSDTPVSNAKLNSEAVTIKNVTGTTRSLGGYSVWDNDGHHRTFGAFNVGPGKTVQLRTGSGANSSTQVYWGLSNYVWNNSGDGANLHNPSNVVVSRCAYTAADDPVKNC